MTDSELDSSLLMPSMKSIKKEQLETNHEAMRNRVSRVKRCLRISFPQKESKTECERRSRSRDQEPQRISSRLIADIRHNENPTGPPIEPSSKSLERYEQDTGTRKVTAKHGLLELDHCHTTPKELSDTGSFQPQSRRRTGNSSTNEEFRSHDDLVDFNIDSLAHLAGNIQEEYFRLHHHAKDIHETLSAPDMDRQVAKEKADRFSERVKSMNQRMSSNITVVERHRETLASELRELVKENHVLREQLNDAQSHIFSLQPYRKDCTPEEIGQEYDALVGQVQDWVQKFMSQWMDCDDGLDVLLSHAKKRKTDVNRFKSVLGRYPDLIYGSNFPETDEDIITSVVMRYLHDNIFQPVLYGGIPRYVHTITNIENLMRASVEPKRDLFTVRTWTAEAYNALLSCGQIRSFRQRRAMGMAQELGDILNVFTREEQFPNFFEHLFDLVIYPAMMLYEKLQISTNHFYLDIDSFIVKTEGGLKTTLNFVDSLRSLDCKNVLQNRKGFNMEKLDPPPSRQELCHLLHNVCSVVPALCMRQIGQGDTIKDPIVVRKQQVLVAWGSEEKRRAYQDDGDRTLISHLYAFSSSEEGYCPSSSEGNNTKPHN
ncbi:hypothetical protein IL306_003547 [Fusarium sp. DS 682]|nr:hypothetical protein IL306_003547 [Fusarium sp. DS 682]